MREPGKRNQVGCFRIAGRDANPPEPVFAHLTVPGGASCATGVDDVRLTFHTAYILGS
jgi:hypothetical protein